MGSLIGVNTSAHWYKDGSPAFDIIGKNGLLRKTTLRDAKKLGLVPSVTTVLGIIAKPQLEAWKIEQAILQTLTMPRRYDEFAGDFAIRVIEGLEEDKFKTLGFGIRIHAALEDFISGKEPKLEDDIKKSAEKAITFLKENNFKGEAEKKTPHERFCGTCDFVGEVNGKKMIVDFKTQTIKKQAMFYDEWIFQLAAYRLALGIEYSCGSLIVGSNIDEIHFKEWQCEEIAWGEDVFRSALELFYKFKKLGDYKWVK